MSASKDVKKKQWMVVVVFMAIVLGLLVLGLWVSDTGKKPPSLIEIQEIRQQQLKKDYSALGGSLVSAEDTWVSKSEAELKELKANNTGLKKQIEALQSSVKDLIDMQKNKNNGAGTPVSTSRNRDGYSLDDELPMLPSTNILPPPKVSQAKIYTLENTNEVATGGHLPPVPNSGTALNTKNLHPNGSEKEPTPEPKIKAFTLYKADIEEEAVDVGKNITHALPSGSFAVVGLLSGMDAPTGAQAASNPVPVVLRVLDLGQLPNFFKSDIANCQVTASGYGDLSSERVYLRTENISCVLVDGTIAEKPLKGYITGEDGKAGLRGVLKSKQGAVIAQSFVAGVFGGLGSSVSSQYSQASTSALGSVTTVDPSKALENGIATGAGNTLEKIADFYLARASEMYPIIEIDAKRIGEIILTSTLDFGVDIVGQTNQK